MSGVTLTDQLRTEYQHLFDTCTISDVHAAEVEQTIGRILVARARYEHVSALSGVPWHVVAVIHNMESGLAFSCHLHNGDPLSDRTVHVPKGRPVQGTPPFNWEDSASDALAMVGMNGSTQWSQAETLYHLERYNGWGYRLYHSHVLSPYLWSYSNHYTSGKYQSDGVWSDTAVSKQCGAAVLLRRMAENGTISFADHSSATEQPLIVSYSMSRASDPQLVARAEALQRWLNGFPGVFVKVDGIPGDRTSYAFWRITGHYLPGDPRAVDPQTTNGPSGARIWRGPVSAEMTAWAESIRDDPEHYPISAEARRTFGEATVLARVEWHTWTYRNGALVHGRFRGVTLYETV